MDIPPEPGFVRLYQIEKKAYATMDSFYIAAWKDTEEKFTEKRKEQFRTVVLSSAALLLSLVNFFFQTTAEAPSVLQHLANSIGEDGNGLIWFVIGGLAFLTYRPMTIEDNHDVYCPPLADELAEARRREAQEEFRRRGPTGPSLS